MSVINDVLNQLEQRGIAVANVQSSVRPVRRVNEIGTEKWRWAASALVLLAAAAWAYQVWSGAHNLAHTRTQSAVGTATDNLPRVFEKAMPASRFSFELSSVPVSNLMRVKNTASPIAPVLAPSVGQVLQQTMPAQATFNAPTRAIKQTSPAQQADAEFRKAVQLMQQGRINEAIAGYEAALRLDAGHDAARQALVALLLENKRNGDAEQVLQEGLQNKPAHTGFAMLLARLQIEHEALDGAIATLEATLPYAGQQADFHAFYAALLQRKNRHQDAVTQYQIALQAMPNKATWLMGYGISLQALSHSEQAKAAYEHALATQTLSADLQTFVQGKLKGL